MLSKHLDQSPSGSQRAEISWREDVPVSDRFDDPYYSIHDGLAETRHVYLSGNDLPERSADGFHVAELGFGTGLNCLATLLAWRRSGIRGVLHYTAFELYPMKASDRARALHQFDEVREVVPELEDVAVTGDLKLTIVEGDARVLLPAWQGRADAWYLDGFAPTRNPELWEAGLMAEVARHTKPGGTFATYTAAGAVRRALSNAGFTVSRVPGFGRKRHMTTGKLD
ncbi:MAG: tRNA (5-methylaminomethyl-2-thiouridine)(34)-methyltransferase MnmD [Boseongicola sp.]|nr:MAG: tRNA (5-methylaminomethyl-2-thiouridine)(34)-methyltransferase MnmD [Boseongicola sp.]